LVYVHAAFIGASVTAIGARSDVPALSRSEVWPSDLESRFGSSFPACRMIDRGSSTWAAALFGLKIVGGLQE
jgi:hypothetical protein